MSEEKGSGLDRGSGSSSQAQAPLLRIAQKVGKAGGQSRGKGLRGSNIRRNWYNHLQHIESVIDPPADVLVIAPGLRVVLQLDDKSVGHLIVGCAPPLDKGHDMGCTLGYARYAI